MSQRFKLNQWAQREVAANSAESDENHKLCKRCLVNIINITDIHLAPLQDCLLFFSRSVDCLKVDIGYVCTPDDLL